jgi:HSP20 family protein
MKDTHGFMSATGNEWLSAEEGKLSVDVLESNTEIIVRSAIAGVRAEDLEITLSDDTLTVRGNRGHGCDQLSDEQLHVQECHWGVFSRTIILPCHVDGDSVDATLKRGILTITMEKAEREKTVPVLEID